MACLTMAALGAQRAASGPSTAITSSVAEPAGYGAELPAPPDIPATLALLAEKPRMLSYAVTRGEDGKWLHLAAEAETAYPVRAATIAGIVQNYVGASKIFSRIGWVKILDRQDNGTITEQYSGVKAFGFKFYTTNRFRMWTSGVGDYTVMHFLQVESGGTMRNCSGYWAVVDRSTADEPLCYIHYGLSFEALDQFPGQEAVMQGFGEEDVLRALKELGQTAEKQGR